MVHRGFQSNHDIEVIDKDIDLYYSVDDRGYYFWNFKTDKESQLFRNETNAKKALAENKLKWT